MQIKQGRTEISVAREGKSFTLRKLSKFGDKPARTKWTTHNTIFDEVRRFGFFEANPQN